MKRHIIFLDIDGTLSDSSLGIPKSAKEAVATARANGHLVCVCTGRPKPDVDDKIRAVGFDGYIYACGCLVEVNDQPIFQRTLEPETIDNLLQILPTKQIGYNLEGMHTSYLDSMALSFFHSIVAKEHNMNSELARHFIESSQMRPIHELNELGKQQIAKISVFSKDSSFQGIEEVLPPHMHLTTHLFGDSDVYNGELSLRSVDKATGIEQMLAHFQMDQKDTIGIGDSMNDAAMITYCARGVAMENGDERLKVLSDEIAPACADDGIYRYFKKVNLI